MVVLFRAGNLPSVADLCNDNAVWFDSLSSEWLSMEHQNHFPRTDTVFMSFEEETVMFWAERRAANELESSMWAVELPDDVPLKAYKYARYDAAHRSYDAGDMEGTLSHMSSYWLSGVDIHHWRRMWMHCMDGYDYPEEWEIKVPRRVAEAAQWTHMGKAVRDEDYFTHYEWNPNYEHYYA